MLIRARDCDNTIEIGEQIMTTPTPRDWQDAMSVTRSISDQRSFVVKHARAWLGANMDTIDTMSTTALAEALWPAKYADKSASADACRKRMIRHLMSAAHNDLADCARRGESTRMFMGKPAHPWIWHAPIAVVTHDPSDNPHHGHHVCPDCGCEF